MKIALFVTSTPFIRGGTEVLVESLKSQLEERGHCSKILRLPISEEYETGIFLSALSVQLFNFDDYDVLISFKWPTYLAVHKRKSLWIFHQFRQVYDLFEKPFGLQNDDLGNAIKEMVIQTDITSLNKANNIFALSNAAKRLKKYSGIDAEVLYTPLQNPNMFNKKSIGNYIYCASRIDGMKRQLLAVEAMKYVKSDVKLMLDGKCSDDSLLKEINDIITNNNLDDKVTINNEFVSEELKIERYANCLAGIYIPFDEDSPGFVTLEIFYSHKTMITVTDSGGVADFVIDNENAFVVEPSPEVIAERFDYLYENKEITEQMGENAYSYVIKKNINWDDTIRRLLA